MESSSTIPATAALPRAEYGPVQGTGLYIRTGAELDIRTGERLYECLMRSRLEYAILVLGRGQARIAGLQTFGCPGSCLANYRRKVGTSGIKHKNAHLGRRQRCKGAVGIADPASTGARADPGA